MYHIPYFKASDDAELWAFMQAHNFVILSGISKDGKQVATHIPVLIEKRAGKIWLRAHIMRKQLHTLAFENNNNVLILFTGPHCYISATWYEDPRTAGTWNYQAVHARGILQFLDDDVALVKILADLTALFENNPNSEALVENMSSDYMSSMLKAIVGFEIELTEIEHVFKMSQNKNELTYNNIINQLQKGNFDEQAVAQIMMKRKDKVFK